MAASKKVENQLFLDLLQIQAMLLMHLKDATWFPPIKSPLSKGPILPDSKPLSLLEERLSLFEILISSSFREFIVLPNIDNLVTTSLND